MSFEVSTYEDLKKVGTGIDGWTLDADYIQTADINASASKTENPDGSGGYYGFEPIGTNTNKFTGIYDGQGHTISNLYINRPATDYIGLFGAINGEVSNLGLVDADITGDSRVGGLCGYNSDTGTITNCYWDIGTSGQATSAGGEGRTTDEMTYPHAENTYVGWNFSNIWKEDNAYYWNNGYPVLLVFIDKYIITKSATNITRNSAILQGKVVL